MLLLLYLTLLVTALVATAVNVAAERVHVAMVAAGYGILMFVLLSVASANIEVVANNGDIVSTANPYLVTVWGGLALFNLLYLWTGAFEAIAEALDDRPRFQTR